MSGRRACALNGLAILVGGDVPLRAMVDVVGRDEAHVLRVPIVHVPSASALSL